MNEIRNTNDEILFCNEVIKMPELPEVETIKIGLQKKIKDKQIKDIIVNICKIIKKPSLEEFITKIKDKKIKGIDRRGKYIIIYLDSEDKLVVEPLESYFTEEIFIQVLNKKKNCKIKSFLMKQEFITGLGNIYANEVLYRSNIHPLRLISSLNKQEVRNLYQQIKLVLV